MFFNFSSYVQKTGKMRPFEEAVRPLYPFAFYMVILLVWPWISPSNIAETDPRALFMLSGTIFSNISVSILCLFFFFSFDLII